MDETFDLGPEARRACLAGRIIFNNRSSVFDCRVVELSAQGARIEVASPLGIPRRFQLELKDLAERHVCELRKRGLREIIVAFDRRTSG
jgi:hypothetical protein